MFSNDVSCLFRLKNYFYIEHLNNPNSSLKYVQYHLSTFSLFKHSTTTPNKPLIGRQETMSNRELDFSYQVRLSLNSSVENLRIYVDPFITHKHIVFLFSPLLNPVLIISLIISDNPQHKLIPSRTFQASDLVIPQTIPPKYLQEWFNNVNKRICYIYATINGNKQKV